MSEFGGTVAQPQRLVSSSRGSAVFSRQILQLKTPCIRFFSFFSFTPCSKDRMRLNLATAAPPTSHDNQFRMRRFALCRTLVESVLAQAGACRVLDIGGLPNYWRVYGADLVADARVSISLLNLGYPDDKYSSEFDWKFERLTGDAGISTVSPINHSTWLTPILSSSMWAAGPICVPWRERCAASRGCIMYRRLTGVFRSSRIIVRRFSTGSPSSSATGWF